MGILCVEGQGLPAILCGIKAPSASWGTVTWRTDWHEPCSSGVAYPGNHGWGIMGGMARGVAFVPAVPGLAPGACMGWAILSRLGKRAGGRMPEGNIRREGTGNPDPLDMSQENP